MLNKKSLSRRLAALSLAGLLLLCSGCGSANPPAVDEPSPSQSVTATSPAPDSEHASSPTDISAPGSRPSATDVSIEREAPGSLSFLAYKGNFTVTNAEGQDLSYDGSLASGTMTLLGQSDMQDAENREIFYAEIPYSKHFTFQLTDFAKGQQWGFDMTETRGTYFTARGDDKVDSFEYDVNGDLIIYGDAGAVLDLTIGMPDSSLGERGWVRLYFTSAGDEVRLEARGSTISFSGLDYQADTPVTVDYGGLSSGQSKVIELSSGSGTLDFSGIAGGEIAVKAA